MAMKVIEARCLTLPETLCLIYSDTKAEVPNDAADLPDDLGVSFDISAGSLIYTGDFEYGIVGSDGTISWK